ncbi:MAG: FAD-dependent oxidoreductase [Pseudomonadota bacterium]
MSDKITYIDHSQWQREVLEAEQPVVVDFYSSECPPCEALAAKYEALAELYGDDVKFIKIFRQENRDLASSLGITGSPTVIFYRRGDRVGDRLTGGIKRAAVEDNLVKLIAPERAQAIQTRKQRTVTDCDVLILGGGPAGLTAGIYTAQAKLHTVLVDRGLAGGNVALTHTVSNYPGFIEPQPGYLLAHNMSEQARHAGVEMRQAVDITRVDLARREVEIDGLETIRGRTVVVATGSSPRPLGLPGELEFRGRGISYCATCDAKYYEGKHVVVIGGGNSALEEAQLIAKFASRITLVHQFAEFQANRQAQEAVRQNPKFEFLMEHEPRAFLQKGDTVGEVEVEDLKTHQRRVLACDGVFIFAGMQPNLEPLAEQLTLDDWGYVRVDSDMHTNLPGVFAAGDVRATRYRQMTTAVADGTVAAMALSRELGA